MFLCRQIIGSFKIYFANWQTYPKHYFIMPLSINMWNKKATFHCHLILAFFFFLASPLRQRWRHPWENSSKRVRNLWFWHFWTPFLKLCVFKSMTQKNALYAMNKNITLCYLIINSFFQPLIENIVQTYSLIWSNVFNIYYLLIY